jgi:Zn-dependent M28 family amino/carboxypeptidase
VQESVFKNHFQSNSTAVSYDIDAQIKNHTARNVIGYLPATKKSKKTIMITAHYDHLGRMGSATYFPGANDNASGNGMLISLAEKFKAKGLKNYNLLFVAFAGEEIGLLGSMYMASHPPVDLKDIKFLLNLDIMGSGEEGITVVNATLFPDEFSRLETINKSKNYLVQIKRRGPAANSDHYFFTEAGVPAFYIYTMGPNKHYHDIYDTYQELSFSAFGNLSNLLEEFFREMK